MKQKKSESVLFSVLGVALMFFIVVAVNLIGSTFKARIDMTEQSLYTLTPGTKAILKKLDSPVEIRFYYSKNETRLPPQFQALARSVDDLLTELQQAAGGNIRIKKFDPQPNSEAEDLAGLDGIEGQPISAGERFYLGLCVSMDPLKAAIPFIAPQRERLIEYDIVRAISQVLTTNRPVVGVMTALPIFGQPMNPMMMRQRQQQQPQEPWAFIAELKRDFDVRQIAPESDKIEEEIKVLFVIHPKNLPDATQYAIDQFIMRGGRLIACLDPHALTDQQPPQNPMMPAMPGGPSNLEKLLTAWGMTFETTKVIGDLNYARRISLQQGQPPALHTAFLFMNNQGVAKDDVAMSQIDDLWFPFAGVFTGTPASGLKQTSLILSSKNSQLVDGFMALQAPQKVADEFKASDKQYAIALRLEGRFKTAFPAGKPEAKPDDAAGDKKDEKKPEDKAKDTLQECKADNAVVLVGDVDWLSDFATVNILGNFGGQRLMQPKNGNLTLVQNIVEQMSGDQNLIGVRSRASLNRPFTVVQEMEAKAEAKSKEELANLQKEAEEANQKIQELQGKKEAGQRFIRSKEQQEEFERFNQKRATANKRLKEIDRERRRDVESLQFWAKVINIAAVPIIVAIVGIALGISRKQKTKAQ